MRFQTEQSRKLPPLRSHDSIAEQMAHPSSRTHEYLDSNDPDENPKATTTKMSVPKRLSDSELAKKAQPHAGATHPSIGRLRITKNIKHPDSPILPTAGGKQIAGKKRVRPGTPHPSTGHLRLTDTSTKPDTPIHPTASGKQVPIGKMKLNTLNRRRTRSHIKKLEDMYPDPLIPWVDSRGLSFSPKPKKVKVEYSPCFAPGFLGENYSIIDDGLELDLGKPAMKGKLVTSHLERSFGGVKMIWERGDWESNKEEVLKEEEVVREKRRKDRKTRSRNGGMTAAQRKRKWRLRAAAGVKVEESDGELNLEGGKADV